MCGIVGYIGTRNVPSVLLGSLWRLEYRGYDSSGIAVISNSELLIRKVPGKLSELEELLKSKPVSGELGIGHTRWATHGLPQENNTHPLLDCSEEIALVVNGIIENFLTLKDELESRGHIFRSLTDSEVIVHLIEENIDKGLVEAVRLTVKKLSGNFAFAAIRISERNRIVCARHDAPLICCFNADEAAVASDISGVVSIFDEVIDIPNDSIVILGRGKCQITNFSGKETKIVPRKVMIEVKDIDKGHFPHFMLYVILQTIVFVILVMTISVSLMDETSTNLASFLPFVASTRCFSIIEHITAFSRQSSIHLSSFDSSLVDSFTIIFYLGLAGLVRIGRAHVITETKPDFL